MTTELAPLSTRDVEHLAKILGMLGSDHAGERAVAGLKASQFIRQRGLTWHDVLTPQRPAAAPPPSGQFDLRRLAATCLAHDRGLLSTWEKDFLRALVHWRGRPSPKQVAVVMRLASKLGVQP